MHKRIFLFILLAVIISLMFGCSDIGSENKAKKDVDNYLHAMKTGDISTSEMYLRDVDNFINVLGYTYLRSNEVELKKNIVEWWKYTYDDSPHLQDEYGTWDEFLEYLRVTYGNSDTHEIINDNPMFFTAWKIDDYVEVYEFVYDMEITNGLGQKVYQKVYFTTEWTDMRWNGEDFEDGFVITNINIK